MSKPVIFSLRPEPECLEDAAFFHATGLDAFALPMVVARYREEAGLGAALVAAAGVGICDDLQAASQAVKFN